ncbi:MAG: vanadium-dependent haloperoxidase [Mycobacterium sp.]|nr:vanadium-dependent haloperoxidase [Mycobacterium sp.]
MEAPRISRDAGDTVTRRSILAGAAGSAGLLGASFGGGLALTSSSRSGAAATRATTRAATMAKTDFDWDNGNAAYSIVVQQGDPVLLQYMQGSDASLVVRYTTLLENAWFDAIAPYHPTAIGVYSNLGRRPSSEASTNRNKNIAILYATYQIMNFLLPQANAKWRAMLTGVGLNPDDSQENKTTPIGIGNLAGKAVAAARTEDGSNQLGDAGGWKYNRQPLRDYTGYQPVNTAYELRNPSRWQPALKEVAGNGGAFTIQQFVTPQFRQMKPYTYTDPSKYLLAPPVNSDYHGNMAGYKQQADEVLARSAALDDMLKMKAEVFNDKFLALGESVGIAATNAHLDFDGFIHLHLATAIAAFDANIACWYNKYHYDAVRPFSAIPYIYGNNAVTSWGGVGVGTVHDMPATQWTSYISVADHPEYPSTSTTLCEAHAQAARRFLGTDNVDLNFTFPKGSSVVEPGITPAADLTVHFDNWTDFAHDCGQARLNGGVHFASAVNAGYSLGPQFGDMAYEFVMNHINGNVSS